MVYAAVQGSVYGFSLMTGKREHDCQGKHFLNPLMFEHALPHALASSRAGINPLHRWHVRLPKI